MKKINGFLLLLVCALFAVSACNNNTETTTTVTKDSATVNDSTHTDQNNPTAPPVQNAPF